MKAFARFSVVVLLVLPGVFQALAAFRPLPPNPAKLGRPARVACVGDSITAGFGIGEEQSYPAQLQEMLGDDWTVGNFGVSGRTMLRKGDNPYWAEKAFQEAQTFQPDAVIIMLGTNDTKAGNWVHQADFEKDTRDLVKTFLALPSQPMVYLCRPTPVPEPGNYGINEANLQVEIKIIDHLAAELHLGQIDMHAALAAFPDLLSDRVHPNREGAQKMAETAAAVLSGFKPGAPIVRANSLFRSHAVLQRGKPLPVWGKAPAGTTVTVQFAGQKISASAQKDGTWSALLQSLTVNEHPQTMVIAGPANTITLNDLLVGDVWVASGQSNMERQLGPRPPQPDLVNWQQEAASANFPLIRQFYVAQRTASAPVADAHGQWIVVSPQTAASITAVGYYFARDIFKKERVPIGLIHASWGGTPAEAWTSREALGKVPGFESLGGSETTEADWLAKNDPGSAPGSGWEKPDLATADWETAQIPQTLDAMLPPGYSGLIWFRKEIDLPATAAGKEALLHLGQLDDFDTTWVNGQRVGGNDNWQTSRDYQIPAGLLRAGKNVIALRFGNVSGNGGWASPADALKLELIGNADRAPISLAGDWKYRKTVDFSKGPAWISTPSGSGQNAPSVLFNAMISPLLQFPINGVIWYQGEANASRALQYRTLLPALIADWRARWQIGDFPFLYVQIAPHKDMPPEIREAQRLTLAQAPNTAMAVITDHGDANNIHPAQKEPVGQRLALAARALAYGEKIEYSGPLYQSVARSGSQMIVQFTHFGSGLVVKDGPLRGFTIAGSDGNFMPADAEIRGNTVAVSSPQVSSPTAVRFGWSNVPDVNLFNKEGLPASPFDSTD